MTRIKQIAISVTALMTATLALANPAVNDAAPSFELPDQTGKVHTLEDYRGQWVVLYFYPKNNTPGCTTEACEFRDNIFAFKRMNAQIIGVSLDDVDSHKEFAEEYDLPFPLLADTEGQLSEAYDVLGFMGQMAKRQTFIINPDGKIAKHYEKVRPDVHSEEVLADLETLGATSS
ncbi:MAG: peroxiredoxin [Pseudomonadota bacterium]